MPEEINEYEKIVIERKPDKVLLKCVYCGGDGKYKGTCKICDGNGKIWKTISKGDLYKCRYCGGDGKYKGTCKICEGVGVITASSPRIKCTYCDGDGKYKGTCKKCNGYGSRPRDEIKEV